MDWGRLSKLIDEWAGQRSWHLENPSDQATDLDATFLIEAEPSTSLKDLEVRFEDFPIRLSFYDLLPAEPFGEVGESSFFEDVRGFIAQISGFMFEALPDEGFNAFDIAYQIQATGIDLIRTVEPDLPINSPIFDTLYEPLVPIPPAPKPDLVWPLRHIKAKEAWKIATSRGEDVRIGHIDTGYADHVDLDDDRLDTRSGWDFVANRRDPKDPLDGLDLHYLWHWWRKPFPELSAGHGTATGSVMISMEGIDNDYLNPTGPGEITGIAPRAKLVPIRSIRFVGRVTWSNVIRGIVWAVLRDCQIISMSLGGLPCNLLRRTIQVAIDRNVIVVAAVGNEVQKTVWPACYPEVVGVGATTPERGYWWRASKGPNVDIAAPGHEVWVARRSPGDGGKNDHSEPSSGTSFATAFTAGTAALWLGHFGHQIHLECHKNGQPLQAVFRHYLRESSDAFRPAVKQWLFGKGIVDAEKLLQMTTHGIQKSEPVPNLPGYRSAGSTLRYADVVAAAIKVNNDDGLKEIFDAVFRRTADALGGEPLSQFGHEIAVLTVTDPELADRIGVAHEDWRKEDQKGMFASNNWAIVRTIRQRLQARASDAMKIALSDAE